MIELTKEYIAKNTFEACGVQKGNFFIKKPSGYTERIPDAKDLDDAKRLAAERYIPKPKRYNHAYTIAFSVDTDNIDEDVTADEMMSGLKKRVLDMGQTGEIIEACGAAFDTYEHDEWELPDDKFVCDTCDRIFDIEDSIKQDDSYNCPKCAGIEGE